MIEKKFKKTRFIFIIICIIQIFYIFHFRSGFEYQVIKNPFRKDSGITFAVSPTIIESHNILKRQETNKFNLSDGLKDNAYLYQRIIEFNYPKRMDGNSKKFFYLNKETMPNSCKILEKRNFLKFLEC